VTRSASAGGFALAFLALYAATVLTPFGQQLDAASLGAFDWLSPLGHRFAGPVRDVTAVAAGIVALVTVGGLLLAWRVADAARVCAAVGAVVVAGELLKLLLPRPGYGGFGYAANTLPSEHAGFVAVALAAALRVAPEAPQWVRRTCFAVIVVAGLVGPLSYAHRSSDALAGVILAGLALVLAWPGRRPRVGWPWFAVAAAAVGLAALSVVVHVDALLGVAVIALLIVATRAVLGVAADGSARLSFRR
jgi:hypothetical protein